MDIELPTVELPSREGLLSAPEPCTLEGEEVPQEVRTGVVSRELREVGLREAKEIARTEMVRRRRRLGNLTQEQEIVIEDLLMSTVTRISELAGRVMESWPLVP
jgi:ribosomal protein S13